MARKDIILSIVIILLLVSLPLVLLLVRRRADLRPRAEFADISLLFEPLGADMVQGETAKVDLVIDSKELKISGFNIKLTYDPEIIEINEVKTNQDSGFNTEVKKEINKGNINLTLLAKETTPQLPTNKVKPATLTIKALSPGETWLKIQPVEVVGFNGIESDVRLNPASSFAKFKVAAGNGETGSAPKIAFKTAFVGISQNHPDLTIQLKIVNELELSPTEKIYNVPLTSDNNSIYSLTNPPLSLNGVSPGNGKSIIIKGPKHLAKKVENRIELKSGENPEFDWTSGKLKIEPGDLPNPSKNFVQDGVVNAVDVSLLISRIGSRNAVDLQVADLNYDGVVNANDLSLLIETLSTRYDDDSL
jgi:hypothetical protein